MRSLLGLSEYYSAELSQKIRRGQNESRIKGTTLGGYAPYGYKIVDKRYVIDEKQAEILQYIFKEYAAGKIVREILDSLNQQGITFRGKAFNEKSVYRMLAQEKYIGISRYKDEVYTNMYPQIISTDIFTKVQKIMAKK